MKTFSYTGLIHILSISGSHIALLLALVYGLGRLIKLREAYMFNPWYYSCLYILWVL